MNNTLRATPTWIALAASLSLLMLVAGCLPGAAWLPDSSGLVFVALRSDKRNEKEVNLYFYDVAKQEKRTLATGLEASCLWPAVSPDGKQIALAAIAPPGDNMTSELEILFYDLNGRIVDRSPKFSWGDEPTEEKIVPCGIYWSAAAKKLLVYDFEENGQIGIYDLASRRLTLVDGAPISIGGSPVLPDGSRFLVIRQTEDEAMPELVAVDWRGETKKIEAEQGFFNSPDTAEALRFTWLGVSRWNGAVGELRYGTKIIRLDLDKLTASSVPAPKSKEGNLILWQYDFPNGGVKLRVVQVDASDIQPEGKHQLEISPPGEPKWKALETQSEGHFVLMPAPNQEWAAIRFGNDEGRLGQMFVISKSGEVRWVLGKK